MRYRPPAGTRSERDLPHFDVAVLNPFRWRAPGKANTSGAIGAGSISLPIPNETLSSPVESIRCSFHSLFSGSFLCVTA